MRGLIPAHLVLPGFEGNGNMGAQGKREEDPSL